MPLCEPLGNKNVANCAREWNIDVSPEVDVTYFCLLESELSRRELMRHNGNVRPSGNFCLQSLCQRSHPSLLLFTFSMGRSRRTIRNLTSAACVDEACQSHHVSVSNPTFPGRFALSTRLHREAS